VWTNPPAFWAGGFLSDCENRISLWLWRLPSLNLRQDEIPTTQHHNDDVVLCFSRSTRPDGEYDVDWQELVERFGWNPRRRQLLDGLAEAVELLATAGCRRLWLNGSFVTAKEEPADFDACWDPHGVDLDVLDPVLLMGIDHLVS
jgi:hypothetical protein